MSVASPPAPRQDEPEALIEEAWELTRRRRRRRIAAAAGVLLVAVGIAAIVGVSQSGGQIRRSGGRGSASVAADGQFMGRVWYTRAIGQRLTPCRSFRA